MKFREKLFVAFMAGAMVLIAGAYSTSTSAEGGMSLDVSKGSSTEGGLETNGLDTQAFVISTGIIDDINIQHRVTNTLGDIAEVGVNGRNVDGFEYNYDIYPGEGSGWESNNGEGVWADQTLSASSADSLHAYASASTAAGDEAHTTLDLTSGSIGSYFNWAYAGPDLWYGFERGAYSQQVANRIIGQDILVQTWTKNAAYLGDQAGTKTEVTNGVINRYSARADAVKSWYGSGAGVQVDSLSASAPDGSIDQHMWAMNYWGDTAEVGAKIENGYLFDYPYASAYSDGINDWMNAYHSVDASGDNIDSTAGITNSILGPYNVDQKFSNRAIKFWTNANNGFGSAGLSFGVSR